MLLLIVLLYITLSIIIFLYCVLHLIGLLKVLFILFDFELLIESDYFISGFVDVSNGSGARLFCNNGVFGGRGEAESGRAGDCERAPHPAIDVELGHDVGGEELGEGAEL